ncbi:MAG: nitroreductase [Lachnospiraceae bacterium]|nr:nitroreductase [Lachnospiraceae bacterium]
MDSRLYQMIFKRKSFHIFRDIGSIDTHELQCIEEAYKTFTPLVSDIKTAIKIVPADKTTCKRGQEYCILLYSEKKENYLQNIGYIGEQLDLYLASLGIGALWFGIGKPDEPTYNGLDFIIMIAIAKMPENKFRKDMFKIKRKPLNEIWNGEYYQDIGNIVRFAPSACNTQPWKVTAEEKGLTVYRYKKPGKRGIMPADKVAYYNRIDIGIFLCFLELCLTEKGISFERELFTDTAEDNCEEVLTARYTLI